MIANAENILYSFYLLGDIVATTHRASASNVRNLDCPTVKGNHDERLPRRGLAISMKWQNGP